MAPGPRTIVGSFVHALTRHVVEDSHSKQLYGLLWNSKLVDGVVISATRRTPEGKQRALTFITATYVLADGGQKLKELNSRSVLPGPVKAVAAMEMATTTQNYEIGTTMTMTNDDGGGCGDYNKDDNDGGGSCYYNVDNDSGGCYYNVDDDRVSCGDLNNDTTGYDCGTAAGITTKNNDNGWENQDSHQSTQLGCINNDNNSGKDRTLTKTSLQPITKRCCGHHWAQQSGRITVMISHPCPIIPGSTDERKTSTTTK